MPKQFGTRRKSKSSKRSSLKQEEEVQHAPEEVEVQRAPQEEEEAQYAPQEEEEVQYAPQEEEEVQDAPQEEEEVQYAPQEEEEVQYAPQEEEVQDAPQEEEEVQEVQDHNNSVSLESVIELGDYLHAKEFTPGTVLYYDDFDLEEFDLYKEHFKLASSRYRAHILAVNAAKVKNGGPLPTSFLSKKSSVFDVCMIAVVNCVEPIEFIKLVANLMHVIVIRINVTPSLSSSDSLKVLARAKRVRLTDYDDEEEQDEQ
jgi:hypothetical protein